MQQHVLQKKTVMSGLALFCCLLWGSAIPCIKIGYQLFEIPAGSTASQILFAGIRFALAGLLTILIGSLISKQFLHPVKGSWKKIVPLSLAQTVIQYLFFYIGIAHTSGTKSTIIGGIGVFFSVLIASLVFRQEKLTMQKLIACLIGFSGVVLVNVGGEDMTFSFSMQGEGFLILSSLSYATSSALIRRFSKTEHPVMLSGYQFLIGGIAMAIWGLFAGGTLPNISPAGLGMLGYLVILSATAYSIWSMLLKYNPVSRIAVFIFTNPMFGVLLSALLLGEKSQAFGPTGLIALLLVCIGIVLTNQEK